MPAPADWLARPLWVLDAGGPGWRPVAWRDELGLAAMVYADEAAAERQRRRLLGARPAAGGGTRRSGAGLRTVRLDAHDPRAREEWLRAVLDTGAARVGFDLDARTDDERAFELTAALLAEVLAHKRGLACF